MCVVGCASAQAYKLSASHLCGLTPRSPSVSPTTSWVYLALFLSLASSMRSSHGMASSKRLNSLEALEISTCLALTMLWHQLWELRLPRSAFSSQSLGVASRPEEVFLADGACFSPALRNVMVLSNEDCSQGNITAAQTGCHLLIWQSLPAVFPYFTISPYKM